MSQWVYLISLCLCTWSIVINVLPGPGFQLKKQQTKSTCKSELLWLAQEAGVCLEHINYISIVSLLIISLLFLWQVWRFGQV